MLSIAKICNGKYYSELAAEDYYQDGKEPPGIWGGKGAAVLGFQGTVGKKDWQQVIRGFDSKGGALVRSAGRPNHTIGNDLCFSAPKSVTLIRRLADPALSNRIHQAELRAVERAMAYMESIAETRVNRTEREPVAGLIYAIYEHSTARASIGHEPDPQDHFHVPTMNMALCQDGVTRTIDFRSIYQNKMIGGAIFRAELARELRALGFATLRDRDSFRIAGITPEMETHFSKRSKDIKALIREWEMQKGVWPDQASARTKALASKASRQAKGGYSRNELEAYWKEEARRHFGVTERDIAGLTSLRHPAVYRSDAAIIRAATKRRKHLTERDLMRLAVVESIVAGGDWRRRLAALQRAQACNAGTPPRLVATCPPSRRMRALSRPECGVESRRVAIAGQARRPGAATVVGGHLTKHTTTTLAASLDELYEELATLAEREVAVAALSPERQSGELKAISEAKDHINRQINEIVAQIAHLVCQSGSALSI